MKRRPITVSGIHVISPSIGDTITFSHPVTATWHTMTVHEYETQQMGQHHFQNDDMEYPTHFTSMTYTLEPEIDGQDFMIRDYNDGDRPRLKNSRPGEFSPVAISSVCVIGGADGPTMIILQNGNSAKLRVACSSLYFEENKKYRMAYDIQCKKDGRY